ncbi:hypothetical protein EDE08_1262 [Bradyrhizobium sp. R2.2-H]|jgi:hypothetical protein|uniref:DUF6161 domain-containing protein n=1 Tax=unclassified Bradyrhizobium TaxID=2631580 RepID=UPI0010491A3D|nr:MULTISPECIES: DUF6161 domain-containing protein [unclassified Bradyrhizobium]TCU60311.1 hypothetical protein EDE10_12658 [Bradyrhizobium sp. Y-H1]TCU63893.1 hypothetical protein EDE08_1262 [Bradyrhizobium sp. R2.2-H]
MVDDAETTGEPFFEVEVRGDHVLRFNSFDDIRKWLQDERSKLQWLMTGEDFGPHFNGNFRDLYRTGFQNLNNALQAWQNEPNNAALRKQQFFNQFKSFYQNERTVLSSHPYVAIAREAGAMSSMAAVGAFAYLFSTPCVVNFDVVRGMLHAKLAQDGISPKSANLVSEAVNRLNGEADAELRRREEGWKQVSAQADRLLAEGRDAAQAKVDQISTQAKTFLENLNREGNAVISSIQATEAAYKAQMALQAPVDYWTTKASAHRSDLVKSRGRLLWFAALGGTGLIAALIGLSGLATMFAQGQDGTAVYVKFAAIGIILTTILFWIGRVLLRIYLSDRHLLTDAEERIAMIKTYLALSNEGKVDPAERSLVLAPIFRSAADGIVKEDGPDATLAGVIAKAIDLKTGKG